MDSRAKLRHDESARDLRLIAPVNVLIQKYGGTSLGSPARIRHVARRAVGATRAGAQVCVVASAMGDTTDGLLELAEQVSPAQHARELDMLLTAGEQISIALLSMAILDLGSDAVSLTGAQAGIHTDTTHGRARIVEVRSGRLLEALAAGKVVIVAGFQGIAPSLDPTTLGRGGSDTTAVALAAALGAGVCEIYTDVEGVLTADPRIVAGTRKLDALSYEEMLELAASGAKVVAPRAVEYARNNGVTLHVRSSFADGTGTWIGEEDETMEQAIISGIAHDTSEAKVTIREVPDRPGIAAAIFRPLGDAGVNVDMIVQNVSEAGRTDVSFTVPKHDLTKAEPLLEEVARAVGGHGVATDTEVARISLVGAGMKTHPGVAADMFEALAEAGINIEIISTSSIRISCLVRAADVERAVRAVHERFRLAEPGVLEEAYGDS